MVAIAAYATVEREPLRKALKLADLKKSRGCAHNGLVRLDAQGSELAVLGVSERGDISVHVPMQAAVDGGFSVTVNAKAIATALGRKVKGETAAALALDGKALVIGPHRIPVESGDQYPIELRAAGRGQTVRYRADVLESALAFVVPAVSCDETRFHLNGALFAGDKIIATDGHRLHAVGDLPAASEAESLVPREGLRVIQALLRAYSHGPVVAFFPDAVKDAEKTPRIASFRYEAATVAIRCINASFPPWEQVVPKDHTGALTVDAAQLRAEIRAALAAADALGIEADDHGALRYRNTIPAAHEGQEIAIRFNGQYLADGLPESGEAKIEHGGDLDPIVVTHPDGRFAVIMPMRL